MKIGIFGGSFNPPHNMHENIAKQLLEKKLVDKIIFVPTGNKYHKKELIDGEKRYQMLQIIAHKNKNYEVSDFELKNKLTYTYQTMKHFRKKYPKAELYFILGADNLSSIFTWKKYKYLFKHYHFLMIDRGSRKQDLIEQFQKYQNRITFVPIKENPLSSTQIRRQLENPNETLEIDHDVLKYIKNHQLYSKNVVQ